LHSRSPAYHNPAFREARAHAVYVPFPVDDCEAFIALADLLDIRGWSVTIPHKKAIIPFLDVVHPETRAIGACNTVIRTVRGLEGFNTDFPGFLEPLLEISGGSLEDMPVCVLGAGGAARAVVYALVESGARVLILNRTVSRAAELASEFSRPGKQVEYGPLDASSADRVGAYRGVIVQTTQVGMHPHEDRDPLEFYRFQGDEIVYDIVYTPEYTRLLCRARDAGCRVISGMRMFETQAEHQKRLFLSVL
jgi:3-dehydroquinate dehydratase / shikimate dehydrogenase